VGRNIDCQSSVQQAELHPVRTTILFYGTSELVLFGLGHPATLEAESIRGEGIMNPLEWRREHQIAIILGAILGAVIFEVIGFMYRGLNFSRMTSELFWSASTVRWAILGVLVGTCLVYVRALLMRNS
jgi:hypothetical protein